MPRMRGRPAEEEECTGMKEAVGDGEEYGRRSPLVPRRGKDGWSNQRGPGNIAQIF